MNLQVILLNFLWGCVVGSKKVYAAISAVSRELAEKGIGKEGRNKQQGFAFRGIDQVYNALAPALVNHGLVVLPRIIDRTVTERETKSGGALFYVVVKAEFDFVAIEDGSVHTVATYGEAMDSGDKATNKAMSIAYKYAAFQTFCIPTEETAIDADGETHNPVPANFDRILSEFTESVTQCQDIESLKSLFRSSWNSLAGSVDHQKKCTDVYRMRGKEITGVE